MTYEIFESLKEAYERSTQNNNYFLPMLNCIPWENKFEADGEYVFQIKNMIFSTPSFNPFNMPWKPSAVFRDGSYIEF